MTFCRTDLIGYFCNLEPLNKRRVREKNYRNAQDATVDIPDGDKKLVWRGIGELSNK